MIKSKFHFFQIAAEIPGADPVVFQQTFFEIPPEPFNAVDRGGPSDIFVLAMVHPMMRFKRLIQLIIAFPRIAVNRRFQGDFPGDNLVERLFRHIIHGLHVHDPIRPFINAKDGLLQRFRSPTTLDLAGFPQGITHRPFAVAKFGATVGFIDFHFAIQQANRPIFMGNHRITQPMEEPMDLLIFQRQAAGDRAIRQFQFEPMQQFVHRRPRYRRPCHPGIRAQLELLVASRTLPALVAQRPQFSGEPTARTSGPISKIGCTPDPMNLRASQIAGKDLFHKQLYTCL